MPCKLSSLLCISCGIVIPKWLLALLVVAELRTTERRADETGSPKKNRSAFSLHRTTTTTDHTPFFPSSFFLSSFLSLSSFSSSLYSIYSSLLFHRPRVSPAHTARSLFQRVCTSSTAPDRNTRAEIPRKLRTYQYTFTLAPPRSFRLPGRSIVNSPGPGVEYRTSTQQNLGTRAAPGNPCTS